MKIVAGQYSRLSTETFCRVCLETLGQMDHEPDGGGGVKTDRKQCGCVKEWENINLWNISGHSDSVRDNK